MDVVLGPKLTARLHRAFAGYRGNAAIKEAIKRYLYLCETAGDDDVEVLALVKFWRAESGGEEGE